MAAHADVVGMTIASECIVAGELGLAYAAVCVVDNLANGIGAGRAQRRRDGGGSRRQCPAPPRRLERRCRGWRRWVDMTESGAPPLAVTGATLDGETVGLRCEDGRIAALGPGVEPEPGDETIDAEGAPLVAGPAQRPHPRRDDALPRLRRRPAVDALAAGEGLAGRGENRSRGRLLGRPARLRRDDSHRDGPLLGHVLAAGSHRPRRPRLGPASDDRRPSDRPRRRPGEAARGRPAQPRGAGGPRPRDRAGAGAALDLRRRRGARCAGSPSWLRSATCRSRSTSPRPSRR